VAIARRTWPAATACRRAATANPAFVLGMGDRLGTLETGKRADVVLLEEATFAQVPYRPGHDPVVATIVGGEVVA